MFNIGGIKLRDKICVFQRYVFPKLKGFYKISFPSYIFACNHVGSGELELQQIVDFVVFSSSSSSGHHVLKIDKNPFSVLRIWLARLISIVSVSIESLTSEEHFSYEYYGFTMYRTPSTSTKSVLVAFLEILFWEPDWTSFPITWLSKKDFQKRHEDNFSNHRLRSIGLKYIICIWKVFSR